jgi:processing peptidase subunit beta
MASRRLALNLTQGLRGRAGLNAVAPLRRGFATPVVKNGVKTQSTTLSNGLTVRLGFGSIALVAY